MKLKELLAVISYWDNLKIYKGNEQYFFGGKTEVPASFHEDKVEVCGAVAEGVMVIYLEKN